MMNNGHSEVFTLPSTHARYRNGSAFSESGSRSLSQIIHVSRLFTVEDIVVQEKLVDLFF